MSIERKDARCYLDNEVHKALTAICNQRGTTIADFMEGLVTAEVRRISHEAIELADLLRNTGIVRSRPDSHGEARK